MDIATTRFADSAREFCRWAEGPPGSKISEAHSARLYVSRLYFEALALSDLASCLDPLDVGSSETSLGDLADDLADIWRDVKSGLELFDADEVEAAAFEWHHSFTIHWGSHAANALSILQHWIGR